MGVDCGTRSAKRIGASGSALALTMARASPWSRRGVLTALLPLAMTCVQRTNAVASESESGGPFIDAHTHLFRNLSDSGSGGGRHGGRGGGLTSASPDAAAGLLLMDRFGVSFAILAPPPVPPRPGDPSLIPQLQAPLP